MTTKHRPLTASLHTVTAVTRVACHLAATVPAAFARIHESRAEQLTRAALDVLGYADRINLADPKQFALVQACRASVQKALQP
jgi:hypothetical protein